MKTENYLQWVMELWWSGGVERLKTVLLARNLTFNYDSASNYKCMFGPPVWSASLSLVEIPILRCLVEIPTRNFLM